MKLGHAQSSVDLVLLDGVLERLSLLDEKQERILELRFFGGMMIEETKRECCIHHRQDPRKLA